MIGKAIRQAQAQGAAQQASGDTELVHGLCEILGSSQADHATWCKLDRLAIGQRLLRGTRAGVTDFLLTLAKQQVADGADNPAAAFTAAVLNGNRFPDLAEAWRQPERPQQTQRSSPGRQARFAQLDEATRAAFLKQARKKYPSLKSDRAMVGLAAALWEKSTGAQP